MTDKQNSNTASMPPFAQAALKKLKRFRDCAEDNQGADIGRKWFDTLVQLGLLERVQRSPALWEITQQGEDLLDQPEPPPRTGHAIPQWLREQFDAIELAVMQGNSAAATFTDMRTKVQAYFEMQRSIERGRAGRDIYLASCAQPAEQQDEPVGWQFICHDGKWRNGDDRIKDHRANTEAAGYQTRDVFARPAAQTLKQDCAHEWTDDGQFLLVCTACGAKEDHDPHWRPIETAPTDGTMLRLLVEFEEHSTEDDQQAVTIGHNSFDNTGQDEWQFAGWCWSHDHYTQGKGVVVGWLPLIDSKAGSVKS